MADDRKQIMFRLDPETADAFAKVCADKGWTVQTALERMVGQMIQQNPNKVVVLLTPERLAQLDALPGQPTEGDAQRRSDKIAALIGGAYIRAKDAGEAKVTLMKKQQQALQEV